MEDHLEATMCRISTNVLKNIHTVKKWQYTNFEVQSEVEINRAKWKICKRHSSGFEPTKKREAEGGLSKDGGGGREHFLTNENVQVQ